MTDAAVDPLTTAGRSVTDWRVPQKFATATSYQVRDVIQDLVVRDLLGPWGGETESWSSALRPTPPQDPRDRYLVGMLGPRKGDQVTEESVDLDLGATVSHEADLPETVNPRALGKLWISSMGLSFQLARGPEAPRSLAVQVSGGRYTHADEPQPSEDGRSARPVVREPLSWSVEIDLTETDARIPLDADGEVALVVQVREYRDRRVVRLTLVNDQSGEVRPQWRSWLFQTSITVTALDGAAPVFVPSGEAALPHDDREEAHLALLYRHTPSFARGHNVSATVDRRNGEAGAWRVRTAWLPVADVPLVTAEPVAGLATAMAMLADLADRSPADLVAALRPMVSAYEVWIADRTREVAALDPMWQQVAGDALVPAADVVRRLRDALDLLGANAQARQAFAFANRAMSLQRHNMVAAGKRERDPSLDYAAALAETTAGDQAVVNASWRPFQLAFVLLNLPALTDPDHSERTDEVDLLFFPTGGGKTEAYLGLAAYTFAIRRLQGVVGHGDDARDGGGGVAVLMRYTLRLLTAQQFQRAAALVCAAEVLRRADPATWGRERFSIGLWVGQSVSPNWYADAATMIANAREAGRRGQKIPVLQTTHCPWCAEPLLGERDLHPDDVTRKVVLSCARGEGEDACPFSRRRSPDGLPIMTVDEEVYREPPSLLIATVDKLAQLPWYGFAGLLFGRVRERCPRHGYRHPDLDHRIGCAGRHAAAAGHDAVSSTPVVRLRPPDLVISDELHLISGALGSTVGLFEVAVEELTSWRTPSGRRTSPKIIASTATTKRAREQVTGLFGRDLAIFPPQVLDSRDTFFSSEQPITAATPGRRYLGLCAHGTRLKAAEIRLAEILLLAGQTALDTYGDPADPYATIVGYFNATRELAGMRRYLDDQVATRVSRTPWRPGLSARAGRELKVTELTSRISSAYITNALRELTVPFDPETATTVRDTAIRAAQKALGRRPDGLPAERPADVVLATSMLQVGVDVGRLGLMLITGQPKNVAEYIQASSRVGREQDRPGLVLTLFNWTRPRDLAYYEGFAHTHATMYARVEALSVTPYARRCLDRGAAGMVVAALRNARDDWSTDVAAEDVELDGAEATAVLDRLLDRAERAGAEQGRAFFATKLAAVLRSWREQQDRTDAPVGYTAVRRALVQYVALLKRAGEGRWGDLTVARSMRETEHDISLLLPPSPRIFEATFDAPAWRPYVRTEEREPAADGERMAP